MVLPSLKGVLNRNIYDRETLCCIILHRTFKGSPSLTTKESLKGSRFDRFTKNTRVYHSHRAIIFSDESDMLISCHSEHWNCSTCQGRRVSDDACCFICFCTGSYIPQILCMLVTLDPPPFHQREAFLKAPTSAMLHRGSRGKSAEAQSFLTRGTQEVQVFLISCCIWTRLERNTTGHGLLFPTAQKSGPNRNSEERINVFVKQGLNRTFLLGRDFFFKKTLNWERREEKCSGVSPSSSGFSVPFLAGVGVSSSSAGMPVYEWWDKEVLPNSLSLTHTLQNLATGFNYSRREGERFRSTFLTSWSMPRTPPSSSCL